jgi:aryl-alcohol dehydrogenase-like predicted oxidoreductase
MRGGMRASDHTRMGQERFDALVQGAYDRGLRMFDLADMYGTHPFFAKAARKMPRDKIGITSKIWFRPGALPEKERPDADVVVERFLKELKTDYLDLVLIHCVTTVKWNDEYGKQMEILAKLKQKGLIRAHGVSCHSLVALLTAASEPWVDSVHARINPFGAKMDGPAETVAPALQKLHAAGKGVIGMKILGEGTFANDEAKKDESIRYVLNLGCVDYLNVGFEKLEELDDFSARVRKAPRLKA